MARSHAALAETQDDLRDDEEDAPSTRPIPAFDLAATVAMMDAVEDPPTTVVSPAENRRLLIGAFSGEASHRNTDDEITLDAPSPPIPPGIPSPLGDVEIEAPPRVPELAQTRKVPKWEEEDALTADSLDLALELAVSGIRPAVSSRAPARFVSAPPPIAGRRAAESTASPLRAVVGLWAIALSLLATLVYLMLTTA